MLLGKRPRFPIKRTTSMSGINVDLGDGQSEESGAGSTVSPEAQNPTVSYSVLISPRNGRYDLAQPPSDHFLRTCGLCKRRLASGRDIFMYRGDTAFCSYECREKQIKRDERKEEYGAVGSRKSQSVAAA